MTEDDNIKNKKYLYKYKNRYYIQIYIDEHNLYIHSSKNYDTIMKIYDECVKADWQYTKLLEIKKKYRAHKEHDKQTRIKEHLYYNHNTGMYTIRIRHNNKSIKIITKANYSEIQPIYFLCQSEKWNINKLLEIKEQYATGGKTTPPCSSRNIKYYKGKYAVLISRQDLPHTYWGRYDTLRQAQYIRDQVLQGNYDVYHGRRYKERGNPKYIREAGNGKYTIVKQVNGRQVSYGTCNSLEQAIAERDWWIEHDWDINCYDLL